jgi:hypothetical protein
MAEKLTRYGTYPGPGFSRFRWTGEKRPPRAGEYYLSGSIIAAHQTTGNLSYPYHIAERVTLVTCPACKGYGKVPQ